MRFYFDRRVITGFAIVALVLVILSVFSYSSTQSLIRTATLQSHATQVMNNAERLIKSIVDLETGQRGYVITGNEDFLQPYYESSQLFDRYLASLDSLTQNHTDQQTRIDSLREMVKSQVQWTKSIIEVRHRSFEEARGLVAGGEGKRRTDAIRGTVKRIQSAEMRDLNRGRVVSDKRLREYQFSFISLCLIVLIIISYLFYTINKTLRAQNQVENELSRVARNTKDLYDNAPVGYHSLDENGKFVEINQTELAWLGYTRTEVIDKLNFNDILTDKSKTVFQHSFQEFLRTGAVHDVEFDLVRKDGQSFPVILNSTAIRNADGQYIKSRSTVVDNTERKKAQDRAMDLKEELEGFTYSVSHDLRAPLRSIIGYATILKEEYYEKMDTEAKRITEVIIRNTARMGQLIDDLLDFSRLGRKPVSFTTIDMKETVEQIMRSQTAHDKERKLDIKILDLEPARADLAMIRQVWINLISNALKYSSKKEVAHIEIGSFIQDNKKIYYVADNGAGFDMKYSDKLFGVFQRLHKMNEFEGTGVGLALVKTIIKRHGGEVWAEGKVDQGAKFYFSLN